MKGMENEYENKREGNVKYEREKEERKKEGDARDYERSFRIALTNSSLCALQLRTCRTQQQFSSTVLSTRSVSLLLDALISLN
jgi:hypothetical protein